eukprot:2765793-Amphidinium_carterae.2
MAHARQFCRGKQCDLVLVLAFCSAQACANMLESIHKQWYERMEGSIVNRRCGPTQLRPFHSLVRLEPEACETRDQESMPSLLAAAVARAPAARSSFGLRVLQKRSCASWADRKNPVYPSLWNKWFPHEPVASSPQIWPYLVWCESGKIYWWCSCGECSNQPWADGEGPDGCKLKGFRPRLYEPTHSGWKLMCGSKKTYDPNGFEKGLSVVLWCDLFPVQAAAIGFGISFAFGIFTTWFMHP